MRECDSRVVVRLGSTCGAAYIIGPEKAVLDVFLGVRLPCKISMLPWYVHVKFSWLELTLLANGYVHIMGPVVGIVKEDERINESVLNGHKLSTLSWIW